MNVRVIGAPAQVTAQSSGNVSMNIRRPGLIDQEETARSAGMGLSY